MDQHGPGSSQRSGKKIHEELKPTMQNDVLRSSHFSFDV